MQKVPKDVYPVKHKSVVLLHLFFSAPVTRVVESEKSVVIAPIFMPQYIWIAAGAKLHPRSEKLARIARRRIIPVPDADAFKEWSEPAKEARDAGLDVVTLDLLETEASAAEKERGVDLADWLIECNRHDRAEAVACITQ